MCTITQTRQASFQIATSDNWSSYFDDYFDSYYFDNSWSGNHSNDDDGKNQQQHASLLHLQQRAAAPSYDVYYERSCAREPMILPLSSSAYMYDTSDAPTSLSALSTPFGLNGGGCAWDDISQAIDDAYEIEEQVSASVSISRSWRALPVTVLVPHLSSTSLRRLTLRPQTTSPCSAANPASLPDLIDHLSLPLLLPLST